MTSNASDPPRDRPDHPDEHVVPSHHEHDDDKNRPPGPNEKPHGGLLSEDFIDWYVGR